MWRMWLGRFVEPKVSIKPPKDFFRNPWAVFLHNHYWKLFIGLNLLIWALFDLRTMLIFCPVNFLYGWTLTNIGVNYLGHYDLKTKIIEARNTNRVLVFLSAGETLQKNHHEYPSRSNLSGNSYNDPALWLVKLLSKNS
jgi:fatty-acid desaturase